MESRFGHDFSEVRVHTDARAAQSAADVEARAYTVGQHVVFGAGEYAPGSSAGRRLVAHELAHVVQQSKAPEGRDPHAIPAASAASEVEARRATGAIQTGGPLPALSTQPLGVARAGLTEKWHALWGVGPIDAYRASEIADEALAAAQTTGLPGPHNGPADAWRHCFWNCRMTDSIGVSQAETIATNHEQDNSGPILETMMDLNNNRVGRGCGGANCDGCCQGKLDTAQLLVIDPKSGALIPSSKTARGGGTKPPVYKNY